MKDCDSHNLTSVTSTDSHLSYDDTENYSLVDVNG